MFQDLPGIAWLLACAAVAPATFIWWRTRELIKLTTDPALPERLLAERQRNGRIVGVMFVLLVVTSYSAAYWTVPLLVMGTTAAGYPLRRVLFEETWSLGGYLWFVVRLFVGVWGFWLVLALLPFIPPLAGRFDWVVAAAVAALLVVWNAHYGDVLRRLLRARPLQDPALLQEFTRLAGLCRLPVPRFEQVDLGGGVIANAIALPSLRRSSVIFTDSLLSRLAPEESAAICAHELAHLEHFNPRLLKRLSLFTHGMIVQGAILAILPRFPALASDLLSTVLWAGSFLGLLIWRARDRQRQETICDQRAVALCGDVEVVVRALSKIHASARLPRRFDSELERHASHPSLARRLRDIRAAAGASPIALETSAIFTGVGGTSVVTFAEDRLQWSEGDVATYSLSYGRLSEVRLNVKVGGHASLVIVEQAGRRWEIAIAPHDVARMQSILDVVDTRLAGPAASESIWPKLVKAVTAFAAVIALMIGQLAMAIVALIAFFHPRSPILAGAGVAALTAAALSFRTYEVAPAEIEVTVALLLAATGLMLLWGAHGTKDEDLPKKARLALGALAACATGVAGVLFMNGLDPVELHQSALSLPSAAVLPLAISATLFRWPVRAARWAAAPMAFLGLLGAAIGSPVFLDRFGDDPFLAPAEPVLWRTIDETPQREFTLPFYASEIQLSPGGRSIIASSTPDYDDVDHKPRYYVGRPGAALTKVEGDDVLFVDDDRLLILEMRDEHADVREVRVADPGHAVWEQRVEGIHDPVLSFDQAGGRWQLLGSDPDGGIVRAVATIGDPDIERMHWPSPDPTRWPQTIAASGGTALVMEMRYNALPLPSSTLSMYLALMSANRFESRLTKLNADGHSEVGSTRLWTQCLKSRVDHERMTCHVFDGSRTRLVSLDAATGTITPLTWVPGRFAGARALNDGWLSGWLGSEAVAIALSTREGLRLSPSASYRVNQITASGGVVATIAYDGKGSTLRLYNSTAGTLRAAGR